MSVSQLATFNGMDFSIGSDINGATTEYTWIFTPSVNLLDGDKIRIVPPAEIDISNPSCTSD